MSEEEDGDEDYRKRRDRNNQVNTAFIFALWTIIQNSRIKIPYRVFLQAVKKSRVKSKMRTQQTLERVHQLKIENELLEEKIKMLTKELGFLKDLFLAHAGTQPFDLHATTYSTQY